MPTLHGARVGLLESRLSKELAELVRRMGERRSPPRRCAKSRGGETAAFVDRLASGRFSVVIFQTGVGAAALLRDANDRAGWPTCWPRIGAATIVCRGPKPTAVVRRHGLEPTIVPQKPFTTKEVLEALAPIDLTGKRTALVHYGERNTALADALRRAGRNWPRPVPVRWALPEDIEPLRTVVREPGTACRCHRLHQSGSGRGTCSPSRSSWECGPS